VKRSAKLLLLAGCALVLVLEGPLTLRVLAASWRGPYARPGALRTAAVREPAPVRAPGRIELAHSELHHIELAHSALDHIELAHGKLDLIALARR
jgi:hypothetical protein